jgi:Protein of unknown function (DUF1573)
MRKSILSLSVFILFIASAMAQTTETPPAVVNPNAPKIVFKENEFDFKSVDEGPKITHEFIFTNKGKEALVLSNVKASCGCTTPVWPKEPILPGQEGKILVTYNTSGRPGPFTKSITITSNADEANKVITIRGTVTSVPEKNTVPVKEGNMLNPDNQ